MKYTYFACIFLFSGISSSFAQLTVNTGLSPLQLVQQIVGPGFKISNVKMNCPQFAIGSFTANGTNLGITKGIVLTTGRADTAIGPNNSNSAGVNNATSGDVQLNATSGKNTYDACSIEFDLEPQCDTLKISYVFGSEEYPEYVGSNFNDIFAFFLSGPGIVGSQNIALVPGTATNVSINNINAGVNAQYFVNNAGGATIEYDGFTKPLIAKSVVQTCNVYHLKIAIADVNDGIFDSGVFIEGSSIQCSPVVYNDLANNASGTEGCSNGSLTFCRTGDSTQPFVVHYDILGTATNGVDYVTIPYSVIIPAGKSCTTIAFQPIPDTDTEGNETIIIAYKYSSCPKSDTVTIVIKDTPPFLPGPDAVICSGDSMKIGVNALPGFSYQWNPAAGLSSATVSDPTIQLVNNTVANLVSNYTLTVTNTTTNCIQTGAITATVKPHPHASFNAMDECVGKSITFNDQSTPVAGANISTWLWDFGNSFFDTVSKPTIFFTTAGQYSVKLEVTDLQGCKDDTIIYVNAFPEPKANFSFINACLNDSVKFTDLSTANGGVITSSVWDFDDNSNWVTSSDPSHLFAGTNIYYVELTVISDKNCIGKSTKPVQVYPKPIVNFSFNNACENGSVKFSNTSLGDTSHWNFGDADTALSRNPAHTYTTAGDYLVTLVMANKYGCYDTLQKTVTIYPTPTADFTAQNVSGCAALCVKFNDASTISGTGSIKGWKWIMGSKFWEGDHAPVLCFDSAGSLSPALVVSTLYGCTDTVIKQNMITVYPKPVADFSVSSSDVPISAPTISVQNEAIDADSITYLLGDGSALNTLIDFSHIYINPGHYIITQMVSNEFGCKDTFELLVHITPEMSLFIPNAFSPDGDGKNEIFYPVASGYLSDADYKFYIYNRWGEELFYTTNQNEGWNGRDGNTGKEVLQIDTYIYVVQYNSKADGGELERRVGHVSLIK